ncbi:MAG: ABC transporter substrate-binding protein [Jatrophihabitans sp.]|nr:MAG: ABC transporter substrate-binding protein [Jatrophihabitans sp.]
MFRRSRVLLAATATAAACALALTGCGSSGGGTGSGGHTSSGASGGSAAAALVPAAIKAKGTLVFAMDATYPPDESIAADGHTIVGFDADLANALVSLLGMKADLQNVTFDNIIPGLSSGKYDIGLSSFTDTKEREKTVDFVTYFQAGEGFYVKAGSGKKFDGLDSLCGHSVAVENGTTEQTDAQTQAKKCSVNVLSFQTQNEVNLAVSSGRADVGFADSQVAEYIVKQSNGQFENTGKAFEVAPYGIALPKGNGMAKAVQAALKELISNGTYMKILDKWGIQDGAITNPVINGATS